jgi:hypothetical protein
MRGVARMTATATARPTSNVAMHVREVRPQLPWARLLIELRSQLYRAMPIGMTLVRPKRRTTMRRGRSEASETS